MSLCSPRLIETYCKGDNDTDICILYYDIVHLHSDTTVSLQLKDYRKMTRFNVLDNNNLVN